MVLKLEQFNIEDIASRNTFRVLRYLILNPNAGFGLSELSELLGISKSNVFRALKKLRQHNLVVEQKKLRKKTYRINSEMRLNQHFWNIFMEEKQRNIPSDVKNAIDLLFDSVKDDVSVFIVFGSVAQGLATPKSDIDVLVVGKGIKEKRFDFLPHRFEIHEYEWEDIEKLSDFVVLEALTGGIIYKGNLFNQAAKITSFSRAYLIYRLEKAKEFLTKSRKSKGEAKKYYESLARITLGEIDSLLKRKKTVQKRKIKTELKDVKELEDIISREGEKIWLI